MPETQIALTEPNGRELVEIKQPTPMMLIQMAMTQGLDADKLGQLMDLQLRWEANEARKSFADAMNRFKSDPPTILKNKHVNHNDFWHATLDNVVEVAAGALSKVGITHHWKTSVEAGKIRVTCVLTHVHGHHEETTLEAGPDTSGSKNPIQAVASTVTYLERYTLLAATGLATKGQDDDGAGANTGIDQQAGEDYMTSIKDAATLEELQTKWQSAYNAAKALGDKNSQKAFTDAKDARKKVLLAKVAPKGNVYAGR